jgi:hypothetical protein
MPDNRCQVPGCAAIVGPLAILLLYLFMPGLKSDLGRHRESPVRSLGWLGTPRL